jgi:sterol desaturase/sphingolipid hydroxylase (fatty acid hydroxylase superfamily)
MIRRMNFSFSRTPLWLVLGTAGLGAAAATFHPDGTHASIMALLTNFNENGVAEYLTYTIGFFGLFWVILHPLLKRRQLARKRWPRLSQISRELLFSLCAQFTMLGVGAWTAFGDNAMAANMYTDVGDYGWAYLILLTFAFFAIDDTQFYWLHRAMHHPKLFKHFHRVHHESTDPTPFTSYAFHPLEAAVQATGPLVIIVFLMMVPWHPAAAIIAGLGNLLFNLIGHLGYEIYPAKWLKIPLLCWKTPALHHYLHHQMVGGNYSLYFRWWDIWCGTEFRDFEARYDRIFADPAARPALVGEHQTSA